MGATLSYEAEPAPSDRVAGLIIKEAANLARIANHWCEPFCFQIDETGALTGSTKVSLPGYSQPNGQFMTVEWEDDMFMMAREVEMLLRSMSRWSSAYKLRWRIGFEGTPVGTVDAQGAYSDDLKAFLAELHVAAGTPRDHEAVKAKVSTLLFKYAYR